LVEVLATYDPESKGGNSPDGRKVKSTMHWVSAAHAVPLKAALYERLFTAEGPGEATGEPLDDLNPNSRTFVDGWGEEALSSVEPGEVVQFERLGYFAADLDEPMLFHRTVGLRDEWAAIQKRG
ncbi:MAG: glutamine--tRNA ligase, partial [Propionibacteriaceae bacterium]|nr:glutamine--tRNA ligase [Propionibacteriaceae bacterium]